MLILSSIGRIIGSASLLINYIFEDLVVEYFWIGNLCFLCGFDNSLFVGSYAIISDETSPEMRTVRFMIIGGLWHVGMALSNLITGYILEYGTFYAVLGTGFGAQLLGLLYSIFVVRSRKIQTPSTAAPPVWNIFSGLKDSAVTAFKKRPHGVRHILLLIIFTAFLCEFTWGTRFVAIDYYFARKRFPWPEVNDNPTFPVTWLSQFYSTCDLTQTVAVFSLVPLLTNVFHVHDAILSSLGHLSLMAGFLNIALATSRNMWYINAALAVFTGTQTPALRALLSKIVEPGEVGKVSFKTILLLLARRACA